MKSANIRGTFTRVTGSSQTRSAKPNTQGSTKPGNTKAPNPNYKPPASVKKP